MYIISLSSFFIFIPLYLKIPGLYDVMETGGAEIFKATESGVAQLCLTSPPGPVRDRKQTTTHPVALRVDGYTCICWLVSLKSCHVIGSCICSSTAGFCEEICH